jgi:1-acyl-sn-glycerol-3-phosphate acyltransferase
VSAPTFVLLRGRAFRAFFATQALTALNDNFFKNALSLWVKTRGVTAFGLSTDVLVAIAPALLVMPFFLFSAMAGQLADKLEKPRIIRAVKVAEVAILGVAAFAFATDSVELLLGCLLAMGIHSAVLGPVKYGILPQLVERDSLVGANALVEMGTFLAILVGTLAGSVVILGEGGAMRTGAAIVVLAVLGLVTAMRIPRLAALAPDLPVPVEPIRPTIDVLRLTKKTRSVWLAALGISWFWLVGSTLLSRLPHLFVDDLGAPASAMAVALSLFCVGIALGSVVTEKVSGKNLELGIVPLGSIAMVVFLVDLAFAQTGGPRAYESLEAFLSDARTIRVLFDLFGLAFFGGLFSVPLYTLLQERSVPEERSRIVAGNNILNAIFMVAGSVLLGSATALHIGTLEIVLVLAAGHALVSIYIYRLLPEFLLRFVAWILSRVMYRAVVTGRENVPNEGAAVIVCNHVSFVDWLFLAGSIRRPIRFVMDSQIAKTPVLAFLFREAKTIPIASAKTDPETYENAFARVAEELRAGELVCIFPEGKLTRDGNIDVFRRGIERILAETPVPVIPAALHGLWGSMFSHEGGAALKKAPRRFRARVALDFATPIAPERARPDALEARVRELHDRLAQGADA